ncbi:MAG: PGPGW domain-containing protein [Actinomycetota bacterium]
MPLIRKLSEYRERQILDHADDALRDGEQVTHWVRVKDPNKRGGGFLFLTEQHCVLYWSGWSSAPISVPWSEITSWGVDRDGGRGPVLGIETEAASRFVQILVGTDGMVEKANAFLDRFAALAPEPKGPLSQSSHPHDYRAERGINVSKESKSMASHTRRVVITILGVTVLCLGIVLLVLPGPGILVLLAGLAILGSEYDWAQDIRSWGQQRYRRARQRIKERGKSDPDIKPRNRSAEER